MTRKAKKFLGVPGQAALYGQVIVNWNRRTQGGGIVQELLVVARVVGGPEVHAPALRQNAYLVCHCLFHYQSQQFLSSPLLQLALKFQVYFMTIHK